jgi:tetratricopeptide (TPR) repeat protein
MPNRRIFLSCVSSEFKPLRESLSRYLGKAGCDVVFQEEFSQSEDDTLEKLDGYIRDCSAVLHLLGVRTGAEASAHALRKYLEKTPDFLNHEPELQKNLGDFSGCSYTQWETYMARHHKVPIFVYQLDGIHLSDQQARHRDRLRVVGRHASSFKDWEDFYGQLIGDLRNIVPDMGRWKPTNLPVLSIGRNFIGRDADMRTLKNLLPGNGSIAAETTSRVIHGLGGVGKTRLALEFAHQLASRFSALLFVTADSGENLDRNLASLAEPSVLNLPRYNEPEEAVRKRAVLHWLGTHPGWLLILDNADTVEAQQAVESQLPAMIGGTVLITSSLDNWSTQIQSMKIDVLSPEASVAFLKARTQGRRAPDPGEEEALQVLSRDLDGLALALEQAGACIASRRWSIPRYLQYWGEEKEKALAWYDKRRDLLEKVNLRLPLPVAATWQATFSQLSEAARALIEVLSYFSPAPIPRALFESGEEALAELMDFSLARVQTEPQGTFTVHPLVQEVVRFRVKGEGRGSARWGWSMGLLAQGAPRKGDDPVTWGQWELLAHHVWAFLRWEPEEVFDPLRYASLLHHFAQFLEYRSGAYSEAEPLCRRALKVWESIMGQEHPDTLTSVNGLASLLQSQGKYAEAELLFRRVFSARERVLGLDHPYTLISIDNLASLLRSQGKYAEAAPLYRRALSARERALGPGHLDTLSGVNNLACLLRDQGAYAEAEPLFRRALAARERELGPEHPGTLTTQGNLASLLGSQGKYGEAESLLRRALTVQERVLGPEHPHTLWSVDDLASLLGSQGKYEEAELLFRRALSVRDRVSGSDHPDTLAIVNNLALLLHSQNKYGEAELLYRRALSATEQVLGLEHPKTLTCLGNLASFLGSQGKYAEAEPLQRRALAVRERVLGSEHPDTLSSVNNLASLLNDQEAHADAEAMYRYALSASERVLGPEHPDTLSTANNLALLLYGQRKYIEAELLYRRAMAGLLRIGKSIGRPHPNSHAFLINFMDCLKASGSTREQIAAKLREVLQSAGLSELPREWLAE